MYGSYLIMNFFIIDQIVKCAGPSAVYRNESHKHQLPDLGQFGRSEMTQNRQQEAGVYAHCAANQTSINRILAEWNNSLAIRRLVLAFTIPKMSCKGLQLILLVLLAQVSLSAYPFHGQLYSRFFEIFRFQRCSTNRSHHRQMWPTKSASVIKEWTWVNWFRRKSSTNLTLWYRTRSGQSSEETT